IAKEKTEKTYNNSQIGNSWISFYLNEPRTIRNKDWNKLEKYFIIPKDLKEIDKKKVKLVEV
ncbi:MAG: site-specific DNA-methyltransferase, partial [Candidatus Celaenobacter polaris]|nr:site-specific DNA-methyltransferase [Candidatus Celaenobacter polaris]